MEEKIWLYIINNNNIIMSLHVYAWVMILVWGELYCFPTFPESEMNKCLRTELFKVFGVV